MINVYEVNLNSNIDDNVYIGWFDIFCLKNKRGLEGFTEKLALYEL